MPRISRMQRDEVQPAAVAIYDRYLRDRGNVPNMFRTMAHRPEIFETIIAHMEAVLNTGTLTKALKELVIVRTSQLNRTPYCLASHTTICRKLGWSEAQLAALDQPGTGEFTEREKVAIHLAEVMTLDAHGYTDADFARTTQNLTLEQQEADVGALLDNAGLSLIPDNRDARATCATSSGFKGQNQPGFIMRYTTASLDVLPDQLAPHLKAGRYHQASIGACAQNGKGPFSTYRIAILLYP